MPITKEARAEARKKLATLLRRVEYGIDLPETVGTLWALVDKENVTMEYFAQFAASVVVHGDAFHTALAKHSPKDWQPFLNETGRLLAKKE